MDNLIKLPKIDNNLKLGLFFAIMKAMLSFTPVKNMIPQVDEILTVLVATCFTIVIFQKKFTIKIFLIHVLLTVLAVVTSYFTGNVTIFFSLLTIFAIREEKNVIYFIMKYEILILFFIFLLAFYFQNLIVYDYNSERYLFSFGLSHSNVFACVVFNIILMWMWCNYKNLTFKKMLNIVGLFVFLYLLNGSKTAVIVGIFSVILLYFSLGEQHYINKLLMYVAQSIVPVLSVFCFLLITKYDEKNKIITMIDTLLTGRVKLGAFAHYKYGWTILGQFTDGSKNFGWDESWQMRSYGTFDNLYSSMIINYGIIWLIVISIAFFCLARKKDNRINCMLIIWAIYAVSEVHGMYGFFGFPILLSSLLLERKIGNLENERNFQI